ncbi:MAG: hypothetical protein Q8S53_11490 [Brevundimonas sp.]|uniref:hypothetical protein n=1 Tax=Brevundimonas sp. TaxID=1871086 RepID=UPI002734FB0F|nr:hypothetical protein [Brevundimonas sp.]MDP3378979.1 hypothetical protein [Brevundimonas sp.]
MEAALIQTIGASAATVATVLGTLVTAVATVFLWRVTKVLAVETKRMAEASAQPQIVAHIEPNQWSAQMHADIHVSNTGNATAFEIQVAFDPPLDRDEKHSKRPMPLQRVSVLKPGQTVSSWIGTWTPLLKKTYIVEISWKRDPAQTERESLIYTLDMNDLAGVSMLGARNPMTQIADQLKKMRDDWQHVSSGYKRIRVDAFSQRDRKAEEDALEQMWADQEAQSAQDQEPDSTPEKPTK